MYIDEVKKMHEAGIYTDEMYNKIISNMRTSDNGQLIGCSPDNASLIYNLKFNPENFNLVELVVNSTPWLGADLDYPELFGKYGYTFGGICDGFTWFRSAQTTKTTRKEQALNNVALLNGYKAIDDATELELWKMLALSERYWGNCYKEWYNHKK